MASLLPRYKIDTFFLSIFPQTSAVFYANDSMEFLTVFTEEFHNFFLCLNCLLYSMFTWSKLGTQNLFLHLYCYNTNHWYLLLPTSVKFGRVGGHLQKVVMPLNGNVGSKIHYFCPSKTHEFVLKILFKNKNVQPFKMFFIINPML